MKINTIAAIIFSGLFIFSGCVVMDDRDRYDRHPDRSYHRQGPPPHAPAHGYRYKHHDGHDLEYDSDIDVYIVVRDPDTYYSDNLYIRMSSDGRWLVSASLDRGWRLADRGDVPHKLRNYKEKYKHKKNKKSDHHDDD